MVTVQEEDFTPKETPGVPRKPLSGETGRGAHSQTLPAPWQRAQGRAPRWTDLEQDHEHLLEVARRVTNDVSL